MKEEGTITKLKLFFQRHRKLFLIATPIVLVLAFAITAALLRYSPSSPMVEEQKKEEPPPPPPTTAASLFTGIEMPIGEHNRRSVAAMIENSTVARPQVGLTSADIVYEAVAEGGITRFMAVYSSKYPDKAGPIRSARSYYIDWLLDYDSAYVHAGGSPTALSMIHNFAIKDYPHSNDGTFAREAWANVTSEHTLFANISKIFDNVIGKKGWSATHDFAPWKFIAPESKGLGGDLDINFSSATFRVTWNYNKESNAYSRILAGIAHKDRLSGQQIITRNIVTMTVQRAANAPYSGTGKESEWSMDTIGEGAAAVYRNGEQITGTWKKASRADRLRFFDAAGAEISLAQGNTWVEVVPQTGSSTYTPTLPPAPPVE